MPRDTSNPLGITLSVKFDPEQYDTIIHKLNQLLAGMSDEQKAKIASVTAGLKTSEDLLSAAVEQNQPKP
jgi:hypothetical protein